MKPPHGLDAVRAYYGDIKIERDPRGGWRIISPIGYEVANCVILRALPGLPGRRLQVHKAMAPALLRALASWQRVCPEYPIRRIGCFNPRPKRVSRSTATVIGWEQGLSMHTPAAALDINPDQNPQTDPGEPIVTDMPPVFIRCFTDEGFTHGGGFPSPDYQHFQYASGRGV